MTRRALPRARLPEAPLHGRGLSSAEADERRGRYGANDVVEITPRGWRDVVRETVKDPMLGFLAATAIVYAAVGQYAEAATLLAAIAPLAAMDAFLHRRTRASLEGLRSRLAATATVVRDGSEHVVRATEVVVGDLVVVVAGEPFPADGLVIGGEGLQTDEALLTGEAWAVTKRPLTALPPGAEEPQVEAVHWVFAGTRLLTGTSRVRIVATGAETLYGEIVRSALSTQTSRTPLQRAIGTLVGGLVVAAIVLCAILAVTRLTQGHGWLDALVSAVTLAAAALPEEFPVAFTFFLGLGAWRLAARQALVRRAVSVENIGRVTTICTDKTGTLTEGRLALAHVVPAGTDGEEALLAIARAASRPETGDPLDVAIADAADLAGARSAGRVLVTFPFTEVRRRETTILRGPDGGLCAVTKGAAEAVLGMSTLGAVDRAVWNGRADSLATDGHRVIACAWRRLDSEPAEELTAGYTFAGILALADPVRAGVREAIRTCRDAGVHVLMVTGDHPLTAAAVAREIGLGATAPRVIVGEELPGHLRAGTSLAEVDVVARAAPADKLALVRALQERGEIVAVTGDGVNDVPALQAADVGIAMGEHGTRSAREVAAIVLLDDNFRTIVGAIAEGRQLYRNLRASFEYLLTIHVPLVVAAALVPLTGYPLLYLPVHIVWLELLLHPTALLAFQDRAADGLVRARRGRVRFFEPAHWGAIAGLGTLLTILVVTSYVASVDEAGNPGHGRAMALAIMSLASAAIATALGRPVSAVARAVLALTVVGPVLILVTPALAAPLHLAPLHPDDWLRAIAIALAVLVVRRLLGRLLTCDT